MPDGRVLDRKPDEPELIDGQVAGCQTSDRYPDSRRWERLVIQCFQTNEPARQWRMRCMPSERELQEAGKNMTRDTFEALLGPSLPSVRRFVRTRLGSFDHADNVIQQTLLQAFAHRDQLRASSKFKSWLCSIAVNEARMFHRNKKSTVSLEKLSQAETRDCSPSPLAKAEQSERMKWMQAGMDKLSDRDREAIRLRDLEEFSLKQMAGTLKLSEAATKSTHFRARRRLACALRNIEKRPAANDLAASRGSQ